MKRLMITGGLPLIALLLLFMATDVNKVPSTMLILPFILLFVGASSIITGILRWQGVSKPRSWRVGLIVAVVPLTLLILQSIGQLTVRDVLTIAVLLVVSYFYVSRSATTTS